jgi:hypothetical protein
MTPKKRQWEPLTENLNVDKRLLQCLPGDSLKRRVWCRLALYSGAFSFPVALKVRGRGLVPVTQADLAKDLQVSTNNVHRCILELEQDGWFWREPIIPAKGLTRGNVQLRFAADPVEPSET